MTLAILIIVIVAIVANSRSGRRHQPQQLQPSFELERDLSAQADRIALLEHEVERLRDQADFTEKLLTERSSDSGE